MFQKLKRRVIDHLLKDEFLKEETFAKLLDNRKIISDFRVEGATINIPDNVVLYRSVISHSRIHTNTIKLGRNSTYDNNIIVD